MADAALIEMEVRVDSKDPRERLTVTLELFEDPQPLRMSLKRISDWPSRMRQRGVNSTQCTLEENSMRWLG